MRVEEREEVESRADRTVTYLLVALIALLPLTASVTMFTPPGAYADLNRRTSAYLFDLALAGLLFVAARRWLREGRPRPRTPLGWLGAAFSALLVLAFLYHPSTHGLELLLRVAAGVAVVTEMRRLAGPDRHLVLSALFVLGVAESVLAMAQAVHGDTFDLFPFEMKGYGLFHFGTQPVGQGSFSHPYHLVCCVAVAVGAGFVALRAARPDQRWAWYAGFAVCGMALGTSYSRTCLLAVAAAAVVGVIGRRTSTAGALRIACAALVVGFVVASAIGWDGWQYKEAAVTTHTTTSSTSSAPITTAGSFDSSRRELIEASRNVIELSPILGVGPGNFVQTVFTDNTSSYKLPPHNWLAHVAGEEGIPAAIVMLALSLAVGWRALRAWPEGFMAFLLLAPFWVLDAYPYTYPHGIALSALWLGVIELARLPRYDAGKKVS